MLAAHLSVALALFAFHCSAGPIVWSSHEEDHLGSNVLQRSGNGADILAVIPVTPKISVASESRSRSASETEGTSHVSQSHSQSTSTAGGSGVSQGYSQSVSTVTICTCGNASPHHHASVTTDRKGHPPTPSTFPSTCHSPTSNATNSHQTAGTVVSLPDGSPSKTIKQGPSDSGGCGTVAPPADANAARLPDHTHTPTTYPITVVINPVPPLSITETFTFYGGPNALVPHMTDRPTVTTTLGVPGNGNVARTPIEARTPVEEPNVHTASPNEWPILEVVDQLPSTTLTYTLYRGADPFQPHRTNRPTETTTLGVPAAAPPANTNKTPPANDAPTPRSPPAQATPPPPPPAKHAPTTRIFPHPPPTPSPITPGHTILPEVQPAEPPKGHNRKPADPAQGQGRIPAKPSQGENRQPAQGQGRIPAKPSQGENRQPAQGQGRIPAKPSQGENREPADPPEEPPEDLPENITVFVLPYPRLSWTIYGKPSPFKPHHTNRPTITSILGTKYSNVEDLPPATKMPAPTTPPPPPPPTTTSETINPMYTTLTGWPYIPPW